MSHAADDWDAWQQDHAAALAALQSAQRAYHREAVISRQASPGSVQVSIEDGQATPSIDGGGKTQSLEALEAARLRLDEVRARMPRR
jgi:hypothetical protein